MKIFFVVLALLILVGCATGGGAKRSDGWTWSRFDVDAIRKYGHPEEWERRNPHPDAWPVCQSGTMKKLREWAIALSRTEEKACSGKTGSSCTCESRQGVQGSPSGNSYRHRGNTPLGQKVAERVLEKRKERCTGIPGETRRVTWYVDRYGDVSFSVEHYCYEMPRHEGQPPLRR